MVRIEEKVPGGKLVRLDLEQTGVRVTGDFFVHPEDGLPRIEGMLHRLRNEREGEIERRLDIFLAQQKIEMVGFSSSDLARMLSRARL